MDNKKLLKNKKPSFSNKELDYLKKVYGVNLRSKVSNGDPEYRMDLNRQLLDKKKSVKESNTADREPGFQAFMKKAKENGYVNKNNYGLYATFYDVYNPKNTNMKKLADEIVADRIRTATNQQANTKEYLVFNEIIRTCEASKDSLKRIEGKEGQKTLDKYIDLNSRLVSDAEKGKDLGLKMEKKMTVDQMDRKMKDLMENMELDEELEALDQELKTGKKNQNVRNKVNDEKVAEKVRNLFNNPQKGQKKVVEVIEGKTVDGMTWEQYSGRMKDIGWSNAENDNYLRSLFNLNGINEEVDKIPGELLNRKGGYSSGALAKLGAQSLANEKLNTALFEKLDDKDSLSGFKEEQRDSLLFVQEKVNKSMENKVANFKPYDFNAAYPPVAKEQVENLDVEQNRIEEPKENREIDRPQVEDEKENQVAEKGPEVVAIDQPKEEKAPEENVVEQPKEDEKKEDKEQAKEDVKKEENKPDLNVMNQSLIKEPELKPEIHQPEEEKAVEQQPEQQQEHEYTAGEIMAPDSKVKVDGKNFHEFSKDMEEKGWEKASGDIILSCAFYLATYEEEMGKRYEKGIAKLNKDKKQLSSKDVNDIKENLLKGASEDYQKNKDEINNKNVLKVLEYLDGQYKELVNNQELNENVNEPVIENNNEIENQNLNNEENIIQQENNALNQENENQPIDPLDYDELIKPESEIKVNGMNFHEFADKMEKRGWPNANKNSTLVCAFYLDLDRENTNSNFVEQFTSDEEPLNNEAVVYLSEMIVKDAHELNKQKKEKNEEFENSYTREIINILEADYEKYLNPNNQVNSEKQEEVKNDVVDENNNIPENNIIQENNIQVQNEAQRFPNIGRVKVGEMEWEEFARKMEEKGWNGAKEDDFLRAAFNLNSDSNFKDSDLVQNLLDVSYIDKDNIQEIKENVTKLVINKKSLNEAYNMNEYAVNEVTKPSLDFFEEEYKKFNPVMEEEKQEENNLEEEKQEENNLEEEKNEEREEEKVEEREEEKVEDREEKKNEEREEIKEEKEPELQENKPEDINNAKEQEKPRMPFFVNLEEEEKEKREEEEAKAAAEAKERENRNKDLEEINEIKNIDDRGERLDKAVEVALNHKDDQNKEAFNEAANIAMAEGLEIAQEVQNNLNEAGENLQQGHVGEAIDNLKNVANAGMDALKAGVGNAGGLVDVVGEIYANPHKAEQKLDGVQINQENVEKLNQIVDENRELNDNREVHVYNGNETMHMAQAGGILGNLVNQNQDNQNNLDNQDNQNNLDNQENLNLNNQEEHNQNANENEINRNEQIIQDKHNQNADENERNVEINRDVNNQNLNANINNENNNNGIQIENDNNNNEEIRNDEIRNDEIENIQNNNEINNNINRDDNNEINNNINRDDNNENNLDNNRVINADIIRNNNENIVQNQNEVINDNQNEVINDNQNEVVNNINQRKLVRQLSNEIEYDQNKMIKGMTAKAFLEKVGEETGWPNAEKDPALRIFVNLYSEDEEGMRQTAEGMLAGNGNGEINADNLETFQRDVIDSVNNCILDRPELVHPEKENEMKSVQELKAALGKDPFLVQGHDIDANEIENEILNQEQNLENANENLIVNQNNNQNRDVEVRNQNIEENRNLQEQNNVHEVNNNQNQNNQELIPLKQKRVFGYTGEQFLAKAKANGWLGAENNQALRLFFNTFNNRDPEAVETADVILNGQFGENPDFVKIGDDLAKNTIKRIDAKPDLIDEDDNITKQFVNNARARLNPEANNEHNNERNIENNNNVLDNNNVRPEQDNQRNNQNPENQVQNDNGLKILEPNKKVAGYDWKAFSEKMEQNGWKDAKNDSFLRATFNLATDSNEQAKNALEELTKKQFQNENDIQNYKISTSTALRGIFDPADKTKFKPLPKAQRESIKQIVDVLKTEEINVDYDKNVRDYYQRHPEEKPEEDVIQNAIRQDVNNAERNNEANNNNERNNNERNNNERNNNERNNNERNNNERNNNERNNNNNELNNNNNEHKPEENQNNNENAHKPEENRNEELHPAKPPRANKITVNNMRENSVSIRKQMENKKSSWLLGGNSKEFKEAISSFKVYRNKMNQVNSRKTEEKQDLSRRDISRLRQQAEQTREKINEYLTAKEKECGDDINKLGRRVKRRYTMMKEALDELDGQIDELDAREDELDNEPTKSLKDLDDMFSNTYHDMSASKDVFWGSSEYDDALQSYKATSDTLSDLLTQEQEGKEPSGIDIAEAKRQIKFARDNIDRYMMKHDNEDKLSDKRAKRMDAMGDGRDNLDRMEKKLKELEAKYLESEPKSNQELEDGIEDAMNTINRTAKNEGVGFGPYKGAQKAYKEFYDAYFRKESERDFDKMDPSRVNQIERKMDQAEKEIDKFLDLYQKEKNPAKDTKARYEAMRQAKESIVETRRKMHHLDKKNKEKDLAKTDKEVNKESREANNDVTSSKNQAFFGSYAYRRARISYENAHSSMVMMDRKNKNKPLTEEELEKSLKEIAEAKKNIAKYISKKRKEIAKNGTLDDKGKRRLAAMERAYNSLDAMEHRISSQLESKKESRLSDENKVGKEKSKNLKEGAIKKSGSERNIDRAAAEAVKSLQNLGEKKTLSPREMEIAKKALAALLLKQHAEKQGKESVMNAAKPKEYAATIKDLTQDKGFRKAFPDKKITPEFLRKIANNPKDLERARQDLLQNMSDKKGKFIKSGTTKNKETDPAQKNEEQEKNKNKNPMKK